jgi:cyclophilin family peptidyl-prolyl cis-trans isomerase
MGDIHIELRPDRAPKTVENFLRLVESGFYDEMIFHRAVRDYVVQTGQIDMNGELRGQDVSPIENEAGRRLKNFRGAVAMARVDDPHSATTEFFINVRDNRNLDYTAPTKREWGYAVFGKVVAGMDVVDEVSKLETHQVGPYQNFPREPVAIYAAYVLP